MSKKEQQLKSVEAEELQDQTDVDTSVKQEGSKSTQPVRYKMTIVLMDNKIKFVSTLTFESEEHYMHYVQNVEITQLGGQAFRVYTTEQELVLIPGILFADALITFSRING